MQKPERQIRFLCISGIPEFISRLRSSAFVHNEYFGKIRCELRNLNEGRRTKTGYSSMSRWVFFWVRARIMVSIHKQRHMGYPGVQRFSVVRVLGGDEAEKTSGRDLSNFISMT
jgi:hypothetical protein